MVPSNLLLDTHILIWWLGDSPRLPKAAKAAINSAAVVWVSSISGWEIETKRERGLLEAPDDLEAAVAATHLSPLASTLAHAVASARLPLHHRDPFDRMLVAQARMESLILVTHDARLKQYDVTTLMV